MAKCTPSTTLTNRHFFLTLTERRQVVLPITLRARLLRLSDHTRSRRGRFRAHARRADTSLRSHLRMGRLRCASLSLMTTPFCAVHGSADGSANSRDQLFGRNEVGERQGCARRLSDDHALLFVRLDDHVKLKLSLSVPCCYRESLDAQLLNVCPLFRKFEFGRLAFDWPKPQTSGSTSLSRRELGSGAPMNC